MATKEHSVKVSPTIITQGGQLQIDFSFMKDPFLYKETDFLLNNTPLKLIHMSDNSFRGEVNQPLDANNNSLSIKVNHKTKITIPIIVPNILVSQFHQLENNVFFDDNSSMIFLDMKKLGDQLSPVLCTYNFLSSSLDKTTLSNTSINAIYIDKKNQLFASSVKDKCIYKIEENLEFTRYAQGLGAPFGMVSNKTNELFVADQKGSLFLVKEKQAIFLCDIPPSVKGYYLAVHPITDDIYISTPNYTGENSIVMYNIEKQLIEPVLTSYNLLGAIAFDSDSNFYWVEHTREESLVYSKTPEGITNKIMSGQFFMGITFDELGYLYINDLNRIYRIEKGLIYV